MPLPEVMDGKVSGSASWVDAGLARPAPTGPLVFAVKIFVAALLLTLLIPIVSGIAAQERLSLFNFWTFAPCILFAWVFALLGFHWRNYARSERVVELDSTASLRRRIAYLPKRQAFEIFLDCLTLLSVTDRRLEPGRLSWTTKLAEQWAPLYGPHAVDPNWVMSIRADLIRANPTASLRSLEKRRNALNQNDKTALIRLVFMLFAASEPMPLTTAKLLIQIAERLEIPFSLITSPKRSAECGIRPAIEG